MDKATRDHIRIVRDRIIRARVQYTDGSGMHSQARLEDKYSLGELPQVLTPTRAERVNANYCDSADFS